MRKKLAVQFNLHKAATVHLDAPRLLPVPGESSKQVVAVVGHRGGWVVDPIVQNVQEPIGVIDVGIRKSANRRGHVIPLIISKLAIAGVVVCCFRNGDWIAVERIICVDDGARKYVWERYAAAVRRSAFGRLAIVG